MTDSIMEPMIDITPEFKCYTETLNIRRSYYFNDDIVEPSQYNNLLHDLEVATERDILVFHINSNGGRLDTTIQLYNAIRGTKGHTVASLSGNCASAATVLFLACSGWEVSRNCRFMIHAGSWGFGGKYNEMISHAEFEREWHERFFKEVYGGFLTKREINTVLNGGDMYMFADDVVARLNNYTKKRK